MLPYKEDMVIEDVDLRCCPDCYGEVKLHRIVNAGGVPYSTINCDVCGEMLSYEREKEAEMIRNWNEEFLR